jgi:hypothetical protein
MEFGLEPPLRISSDCDRSIQLEYDGFKLVSSSGLNEHGMKIKTVPSLRPRFTVTSLAHMAEGSLGTLWVLFEGGRAMGAPEG